MLPTFRYVLLTALRDRLFAALLALMVGSLLVAAFMGDAAIAEGSQLAMAYGATAVRLVLILGIVIFGAFHIRRLTDSREIEAMLARPVSREQFVFAYFLGHAAISVMLALAGGGAIGLILQPPLDGLALWTLSLMLEALVVTALTLFAGLSAGSAVTAALTAFGFYALARLTTFFLDVANNGMGDLLRSPAALPLKWIIGLLQAVLPRLDLFGQTQWLAYGWPQDQSPVGVLAHGLIGTALLVLAAVFDLRRRRF